MTITRTARLAALALTGALALAACGSDGGGSTSSPTAGGSIDCVSGSLKASGSSAQKNAMAEWINGYQTGVHRRHDRLPGQRLGRRHHRTSSTSRRPSPGPTPPSRTTTRRRPTPAAPPVRPSTSPWSAARSCAAYNVSGVEKLILTSDLLAGIFGNTITKWNDPKIAAANPGVTPPRRDDRAVPPQRLVRHDGQLHQVPRHDLDAPGRSTTARSGRPPAARAPRATTASAQRGEVHRRTRSATSSSRSPRTPASSTAWVDNGRQRRSRRPRRTRPRPSRRRRSRARATTWRSRSTTRRRPATPPCSSPTRSPARRASTPPCADLTKAFLTYTASDEAPGEAAPTRLRADHRRPADQGPRRRGSSISA